MTPMRTFYVTFGCGTLMAGYHQQIDAKDNCIVAAWMEKHYRGLWSTIYTAKPRDTRPMQDRPYILCYQDAKHI